MPTTIDRDLLREIRSDIEVALKIIAEAHGISLTAGSCRFGPDQFTLKIEGAVLAPSAEGEPALAADLVRRASLDGIPDITKKFIFRGSEYSVTGHNLSARKNCYRIKRLRDGKTFRASANLVKRGMGLPVAPSIGPEADWDETD